MNKQIILFAGYVLIAALLIIGVYYLIYTQHQSRTFIITDDGQISENTQKIFHQKAIKLIQETRNVNLIFEKLKQEFPTLENISINTFSPWTIKCRASFDQPLIMIRCENHASSLLSKKGFYTKPDHYRPDIVKEMPSLLTLGSLSENDKKLLYRRVQTLPENFFHHNALEWHNTHELIMHCSETPEYTYIMSALTPLTLDLIQQRKLVQEKIEQKKNMLSKKNKPKKWKIDIRFKDQIITKGVV
jgi:hypothetical protein